MHSSEAEVGKRVQVRPGHRRKEFWGVSGTIRQVYGVPDYLALEVEFPNGRSELFWHHELDEAGGGSVPRSG